MFNQTRSVFVAAIVVALSWSSIALGAPSQSDISKEINTATSAATAVVAGLQAKINGGSLKSADAETTIVRAAFRDNFKKISGSSFDESGDVQLSEIRKLFDEAFVYVIDKFRQDMLKGGQDAFVPAFFRAQLLDYFNNKSQGRYLAIVTMRNSELINRDSAPEKVISDKAVIEFVKDLLEKGEVEPQSKAIGTRFVGYWPMKIAEPCAACHQRSGLEQKVGAFGGATVVVVEAQR
jgi:hypothetical protein